MYPFLIFAQGLHNARPDLRVFERQEGVLLKAVDALLSLSDADGEFFPLNDAQKGMSYRASSIVTAVNIAFHVGGQDPRLLSIAVEQGEVLLDDAGFSVARAIRDGKTQPFEKRSVNLSDGADGTQGGVAVLRLANEDLELVFKYSSQGLSHGHYDKLSYSLYENGDDVLQDYGMARFVNIEQKGGGNYLPENTTWAKQTIAHNTLIRNETSHFQGKYENGSQHHSDLWFYDDNNSEVQVVSASESNAYPGTRMRRTMAMIGKGSFEEPLVLDILKVESDGEHQYDLPFYFMGQVVDVNFEYEVPAALGALGENSGYQHLYLEGRGVAATDNTTFSWMDRGRFYTLTSVTEDDDELLFTRIGANDPDFNLRREAAFMIRRQGARDTIFATIIEPHGGYSPVTELSVAARSRIAALEVVHDDDDYTAISIEDDAGRTGLFVVSNSNASGDALHRLKTGDAVHEWTGPYAWFGPE